MDNNRRQNGRPTPTYVSWAEMKTRCLNENKSNYENYGGRGIWLDKSWHSFDSFLTDMGERPEGCSLERINNDGPYTKDNCRWATPKQQANNRRAPKMHFDNKMGVKNVCWDATKKLFIAYATEQKKQRKLYTGPDFFEACCARKSWENRQFE